MKSLNKKIGVVALSGALLIGGVIASGKIEAYADNKELNELCYLYGFDVIDENHNEEDDIQKDVNDLGMYYGVKNADQIKFMSYGEFKEKIKGKNIKSGMYLVKKNESLILIGIPVK